MSYLEALLLTGKRARLEALSTVHADDLRRAVSDGELWRTWYTRVPHPDAVDEDIDRRLSLHMAGEMTPWAVRDLASGRVVGVTSFEHPDQSNRRVEIGSTWLAKAVQGAGINTEAKLLLLERAFEDLDSIAVEFRTHWHNRQSRAAILSLGAKQDGVLRNHRIDANGVLRDTVVFSITSAEWPTVRLGLIHKLHA